MAEYYMPGLYNFLRELRQNNNREWFQAHKADYERLRDSWLADLQRLIDLMGTWEPALSRFTAKDCAYRIYRDIRFSPDKTPYKTYFSALICPYGRRHDNHGGYYIQIDPDEPEAGLYGGIWWPEAPLLKKLRNAIVDNIEEWDEAVSAICPAAEWVGDELKTAPKGWPKDHPQIKWLRMKSIGVRVDAGEDFFCNPGWVEKASEIFRSMHPMINFLNYSIEEE